MPQPRKPARTKTSRPDQLATAAAVAAGGLAGAGSRWVVGELISDGEFPWSTLMVNLVGAFLLGVLAARLRSERPLSDGRRRTVIGGASGFCGSLTTFSAFAVESADLLTGDAWGTAAAYLVVTLGAGLALTVSGLRLGAWRFGP